MSLWFAAFRILLPDALTQNLRVASDTYTFMSLDPNPDECRMSAEFLLSGPAVPEAFAAALLHHQEGRLSEAEGIYRAIPAVDPANATRHDALGKTLMAKGDMA